MTPKTKETLRAKILRMRNEQSPEDIRAASRAVNEQLARDPRVAAAGRIALYLARPGEVRTCALIAWAEANGKAVFMPAFSAEIKQYCFCRYDPSMPLSRGPRGVLQPAEVEAVDADTLSAIVTPAVACDADGRRLGFGGGTYDRLLGHFPSAFRIAPLFDFQCVDRVPTEPHDEPVDALALPDRIMDTGARFKKTNNNTETKGTRP